MYSEFEADMYPVVPTDDLIQLVQFRSGTQLCIIIILHSRTAHKTVEFSQLISYLYLVSIVIVPVMPI